MATLADFTARSIDGTERKLSDFSGKVCLVVNVASACGLTPQYDGLVRLDTEYRDRGLAILAFPCNQFAGQEPGDEAEIAGFCRTNYGVDFPLFAKIEVNGAGRHPLYAWLTAEQTQPDGPGDVAWNFAKFLVGRDGRVLARFAPPVEPCSDEVKSRIESALG
ncbi:MAG: glutathione peroxidase [Spirochaetaceae bacterium]|nr:glutathione peroxidase [Myxococcales bacterium]MCB9723658.1 glutathione peroxidase [Spirochaetaceae bacterium]HPG25795.1 glutathione peroxidase [Myxococcota bacterium]